MAWPPSHRSKLDALLGDIAARGLSHASAEAVEQTALELWLGPLPVALDAVVGPYASDAVQLVERLAGFPCVGQDRRKQLLSAVKAAGSPISDDQRVAFQKLYRSLLPSLQALSRGLSSQPAGGSVSLETEALTR